MTTTTHLESMEVEVDPVLAATLTTTSPSDPQAIGAATAASFGTLGAFLARHALSPCGPPRTIYTTYGPRETTFTVAFPLAIAPAGISEDGVRIERLPGVRALRFVHRGPYDTLRETYGQIDAWLRERGGIKTDADWARYSPMWEEYMNDPATTPPAELVTRIYLTLP
jgi:effector-binding domain-containing protein